MHSPPLALLLRGAIFIAALAGCWLGTGVAQATSVYPESTAALCPSGFLHGSEEAEETQDQSCSEGASETSLLELGRTTASAKALHATNIDDLALQVLRQRQPHCSRKMPLMPIALERGLEAGEESREKQEETSKPAEGQKGQGQWGQRRTERSARKRLECIPNKSALDPKQIGRAHV